MKCYHCESAAVYVVKLRTPRQVCRDHVGQYCTAHYKIVRVDDDEADTAMEVAPRRATKAGEAAAPKRRGRPPKRVEDR